jgi:glycosyltransferase involved in cell wall biosynthesis
VFHDVSVSVVIPTLNEAENLTSVLPRIPHWVDEVVLVDGYSDDDTVDVAREVRPDIRVVFQEGRGKGAALRSGFAAATCDVVVMVDADGSTDPKEMSAFVGALLAGADLAKGSRFIQGGGTDDMPFVRRFANDALVKLSNILYGTQFTDITYGYNATWRKHKHVLSLPIDGWAHEIVRNIRAARVGLRVVEVASFEHNRLAGEAKLKPIPAGWTILTAMLAERFTTCVRAESAHQEETRPEPAARRRHIEQQYGARGFIASPGRVQARVNNATYAAAVATDRLKLEPIEVDQPDRESPRHRPTAS